MIRFFYTFKKSITIRYCVKFVSIINRWRVNKYVTLQPMQLQYTYRTVMKKAGWQGRRFRPRRAPARRRLRGLAAARAGRGAPRARRALRARRARRGAARGTGETGSPSPRPPTRGCGSPASLSPTSACESRPPGRITVFPARFASFM